MEDIFVITMFEVIIIKRCTAQYEWRVCDRAGTTMMWGWEQTYDNARYKGNRALFLLLGGGRRKTDRSAPLGH